jgi:hypothetical protein
MRNTIVLQDDPLRDSRKKPIQRASDTREKTLVRVIETTLNAWIPVNLFVDDGPTRLDQLPLALHTVARTVAEHKDVLGANLPQGIDDLRSRVWPIKGKQEDRTGRLWTRTRGHSAQSRAGVSACRERVTGRVD